MGETSSSDTILPTLQRIARLAQDAPEMAFTTLAHHLDLDGLREAYRRTRKDGAVGVDGQTAAAYAANLEANLQALRDRVQSGRYHAPPVRRVHIPKGSGPATRPIGIPTFEDKVLQRAVAMLLEAIYEQDFTDSSYGFRPGRSAHQALDTVWKRLMGMRGGWVVEVDIQRFFDTLDHGQLRAILDRRVRDGVLRRLIGKWLNAGVLEAGRVAYPEEGTPQGGVISPLLANLYLHEVLDAWWARDVLPRLTGPAFLVRYADDILMGFAEERDARKVLAVLPKRFGRFGLTLHPEKTRLVPFQPPPSGGVRPGKRPGTFNLLGLTHYWGRSRRGQWVIIRRTAKDRFSRAVKTVAMWVRTWRHLPIEVQWKTLSRKLQGHYAYYGITGNAPALSRFREAVQRSWRKWLSRRSQRGSLTWERFNHLRDRYRLPPVVVVHSVYRRAATP